MQIPEYHDKLTPGKADAISRIKDISEYFREAERASPRLRRLRINAILRLREEGMTVPEIIEATGIKEHRIRDIIKEERRIQEMSQ